MTTLFKNAKVLDLDSESGYYDGYVVVIDNLITYAGPAEPKVQCDEVIDVKGNILMPGFVNAHAHTPMSLLRGIKDDAVLQDWLDVVTPIEEQMTNTDAYWGELLGIAEYVKNGITAVEENYFKYEGVCKAINVSGMRARIGLGPWIRGLEAYTPLILQHDHKTIQANTNSNMVNVVCYAHSIYGLKEDMFFDLLKYAKEQNLPLSIHLSETLKEVGDCTQKHNGLTPPALLEQIGFLDRPCLCYHCVHMDKDDLQILADYGASITTCPSSNIKLASGIAPIFAMQNKGINVAIGTDGPASNNSLDMFKEMYLVATLSKVSIYDASVVTARQVLKMATINGAKALGINSGEIKEGKNADIILIKLTEPHMQPVDNLISNLVYSANCNDVYFTMIGGKVVYDNGIYNIGEDIRTIMQNANKIRQKITKNTKKEG